MLCCRQADNRDMKSCDRDIQKKQNEVFCENFEISITVSKLHAKTAAFESCEFGARSMNSFYICTATRALTLAWSAPPPFFGVLSGSKMNLRALMCDILDAISYVHATFHFTFSHSHHVSL